MNQIIHCLTTQHDPWLVFVAVILCLVSLETAFRLYSRACNVNIEQASSWLFLTGLVTGSGIWATHFVAMLAYDIGQPTSYTPGLTLLSLFIAILSAVSGFAVARNTTRNPVLARSAGGMIIGIGSVTMHYIGMASLRVAGHVSWDVPIVIWSVILAAAFGMLSLVVAENCKNSRRVLIGTALLAVAIITMHFSAMGAVIITLDPTVIVPEGLISGDYQALEVASLSLLIIGTGYATSTIDQNVRANADEKLQNLADAAIEGIVITQDNIVTDANTSFLSLIDEPRENVVGKSFIDVWLCESDLDFHGKTEDYCESILVAANDGRIPVEVIRRHMQDDSGDLIVYAIRDLRERIEAESHIRFLAEHDPLTGLINRTTFHARLENAIETAAEKNRPLTILSIDFDRFKEVNDVYGPSAGDHVLHEIGSRLRDLGNDHAFFSRVGGDEFVAVLSHSDSVNYRQDTLNFAARILDALAPPITINPEDSAQVSASIGMACFPDDGPDGETVLFNADLALYRSKLNGWARMMFFEPEMDSEHREKRQISAALSTALQNDELEIHYQPQCRTECTQFTGFEALLRWKHPELGNVSPALFIPIAEETGQVAQLGEWVLRHACAEAASWPNNLRIAVNLSPVQLQQPDLADMISDVLQSTGLAPNRLELEITETALIHNPTRSRQILDQIKKLGVCIAMDDFGTGYSSLATLLSFPFDKIKIDRSFVSCLINSEEAIAIVRAVINLSRDLKMQVIAEGVETEEQAAFLLAENCTEVQGYKYGHPRPIKEYHSALEGVLTQLGLDEKKDSDPVVVLTSPKD
ncbi:MAG: EAL domain-containing protein [Rhodospirillales bacterium]|nr:EAL domain-containing protein [Rhodospirillales bacterium]